jgi:P27 family predicted phage terminase small subunit
MPGPAKKPALQVVREGNPAKRPIPESVVLPPATFAAPDWQVEFPLVRVHPRPTAPGRRRVDEDQVDYEARQDRYERQLRRWEHVKLTAEGSKFGRERATSEWERVVPVLLKSVGLGNPDFSTVVDYCVCVARLEWCERRLSREGLVIQGAHGMSKNPLTTVATQYRTQLKTYIRELGLSPSARTGVPARKDDDGDEDPFD